MDILSMAVGVALVLVIRVTIEVICWAYSATKKNDDYDYDPARDIAHRVAYDKGKSDGIAEMLSKQPSGNSLTDDNQSGPATSLPTSHQ